ncbi:hypothetical protein N7468_000423 [Penicillium chermesinum]|uniref:75k gamma secalin n=1 Tax=Penicillium chermesinum TaxID=63820 RepID=A0A9W9PKA4_9EURO|nr:uncharacterized protein N7468_000423 [Penicillium chermesinum]KAJ5248972.1 hypothetical protein N7468_000423 [Penicillium chermesinum]
MSPTHINPAMASHLSSTTPAVYTATPNSLPSPAAAATPVTALSADDPADTPAFAPTAAIASSAASATCLSSSAASIAPAAKAITPYSTSTPTIAFDVSATHTAATIPSSEASTAISKPGPSTPTTIPSSDIPNAAEVFCANFETPAAPGTSSITPSARVSGPVVTAAATTFSAANTTTSATVACSETRPDTPTDTSTAVKSSNPTAHSTTCTGCSAEAAQKQQQTQQKQPAPTAPAQQQTLPPQVSQDPQKPPIQAPQPQTKPAPPPAQPPPPSLPPPEPQQEFVNPANLFVNPANLFVQTPLPAAPRSWFTSSQFDSSALSETVLDDLPPISEAPPTLPPENPPQSAASPSPAEPSQTAPSAPAPLQASGTPGVPSSTSAPSAPGAPKAASVSGKSTTPWQSSFQLQPSQPVKPEMQVQTPAKPKPSPKVEAKRALSAAKPPQTPKATPMVSRPVPSPITPQIMVPAPSQEFQAHLTKQPKKQQQQKKQTSQQTAERAAKPSKPPVDYQVLLLSLADEYLNAAHSLGSITALANDHLEVEQYYKLIATGLGCLEAVLKNWRLPPRHEALVRLRYARTLFEETDNDIEAETALSKGIDLCERNRMLDLKYSMQLLLARMLHKTNSKASLKAIDGMIQDVETYRHTAWEYAFRFLRVSLSLSSSSHQETLHALQHLNKITALSGRNADKAVSAMAAVIEALAHLQQGSGSDAIEQAQRAIASARSHQLNDELRNIPQLVTLIQMVDICCSVLEYDINSSSQKLKAMQDMIDQTLNDPIWRQDGSFSVPLNGKSPPGPSSMDTGDILQVENGTLFLSFTWLPQHDLYALSYFLSSVTLSAKNSHDGRKAEKYLDEGLRMVQGSFTSPQEISESMVTAAKRVEWRRSLYCNFLLQRVFLACSRTDWDLASQTLKELRQAMHDIGPINCTPIECLMEYAAGTIAQATGDLAAALKIFQSPLLSLSPTASKTSRNDPCRDTCILAALNTILIIRDPAHPSHSQLPTILEKLDTFCQHSPNKYIQAAYFLICATVHTDSTIQTKQHLQQALQSATAISNSQITCMTLTFMSWKYFRGVVGEQAEKSARAGRAMAKRANDRLWASVTDEMLADTLERQGKGEEARGVRDEGQRLIMGLPPDLKRSA